MANVTRRPFYHQFAWAYDLIQRDPVAQRVEFTAATLTARGVLAGSTIVDAGCGTGPYSWELAGRGYCVLGVDRSGELIAQAHARGPGGDARARFAVQDLLDLDLAGPCDAVLCRGVLNDFVEDAARQAVFARFAAWLRDGGALVFDVRDWERSAEMTL